MVTMTELQRKAGELCAAFEVAYRSTAEPVDAYYRLRDGSPEWMHEVVRAAHGTDMLPDDWRFETIMFAAEALSGEDADDDYAHEFAGDRVDAYTDDRFAWLSSHLHRASYCDEAVADGMCDVSEFSIVAVIGAGQYTEAYEVFLSLRGALESVTDTPAPQ